MVRQTVIHLTIFTTLLHAVAGCHWHPSAQAQAVTRAEADTTRHEHGCPHHPHDHDHEEEAAPASSGHEEPCEHHQKGCGDSCFEVTPVRTALFDLSPALSLDHFAADVPALTVTAGPGAVEHGRLATHRAIPLNVRAHLWHQIWLL